MTVTRYEIDMLDVKSADAFLIHFFDDDTDFEYIVLIDGGNYEDGKEIANFIRKNYTQDYIDLVICTHCDKDHFGGILYLLKQQLNGGADNLHIKEIWVNDPADHVKLGEVKWIRKQGTLTVKARSVFDLNKDNMLDIIDDLASKNMIRWYEPFSDAEDWPGCPYIYEQWEGLIEVLGPTVDFYETLVPDFRNDLQRIDYTRPENEEDQTEYVDGKVINQAIEKAGDDPSSHNQSSVIVRFNPSDGRQFLFLGDAGKRAIDNMQQSFVDSLINTYWLKVPHHGSIHNMDSQMINQIHPKIAYISTEKYGKYLNINIVKSLKKIGTRVYSTNINKSMCHRQNLPSHKGYVSAKPL